MMGISVTNSSGSGSIDVAINRWGADGSTDFFTINAGKTETWDRTDKRGFVMSLQNRGHRCPYFVLAGDTVDFNDGTVRINNKEVQPIGVACKVD
jgi:hypothetical protein